MFETYDAIFNQRGDAYHQAMKLVPDARRREFRVALDHLKFETGDVVCDLPSGGGYLAKYLPAERDLRLIAVDPSEGFAKQWTDIQVESYLAPLHALPLSDNAVDVMVSIAGLHHVDDRPAVFREMRRVLRPEGQLCILEVAEGSPTDTFLNGFVDTYSSMGHRGHFVDEGFRNDLESAGFRFTTDELCRYTWDFPDESHMAEFVRLIFGLDNADRETVLQGISSILGSKCDSTGCRMNWALQLLVAD